MEKDYSKSPVSKKTFSLFQGLFICLFSLILLLGVGIIARGISFPFVYLFGDFSYLMFLILFLFGIKLMFQLKPIKKTFCGIFGFSLILIGLSVVLTAVLIATDTSLSISNDLKVSYFNSLFESTSFFQSKDYLILFTNHFSGGLVGYALAELFLKVGYLFVYIFSGIICILGILVIFAPSIRKSISKRKENKNKQNQMTENLSQGINYDPIKSVKEESKPVHDDPIMNFSKPNTFTPSEENENHVSSNVTVNGFSKTKFIMDVHVTEAMNEDTKPMFSKPCDEDVFRSDSSINEISHTEAKEVLEVVEDIQEEEIVEDNQDTIESPISETNDVEIITDDVISETIEEIPVVEEKPEPIEWVPPSSSMLLDSEIDDAINANTTMAEDRKELLNKMLDDYGTRARVVSYIIGPTVTRFNIEYDTNASAKPIAGLVDDISRRLGGVFVRFEPVIEGSFYSGLEVPNPTSTIVSFKETFEHLPDVKKHPYSIAFGKNISGNVVCADFDDFPHMLVAGTSGSGKSIFIHSLIATLIMRNSPDDFKLAIIDPKLIEFKRYNDIPHLLCPVINSAKMAKKCFDELVKEMDERYKKLSLAEDATSLKEYNQYAEEHGLEKLPYILLIVDEFGDLIEHCKEINEPIQLLGQKARACGISMLLATQSPNTTVISGTIKSNLQVHVALSTSNSTQSVTILGEGGAEKLLGKGDMLVQTTLVSRIGLVRLQSCYIQKKEISNIVGYLKEHYPSRYSSQFMFKEDEEETNAPTAYQDNDLDDEADEETQYNFVKDYVTHSAYMSISKIQTEWHIGFNKARRFFFRLQKEGYVAFETEGNKGSPVLKHDYERDYDNCVTSDEQSEFRR